MHLRKHWWSSFLNPIRTDTIFWKSVKVNRLTVMSLVRMDWANDLNNPTLVLVLPPWDSSWVLSDVFVINEWLLKGFWDSRFTHRINLSSSSVSDASCLSTVSLQSVHITSLSHSWSTCCFSRIRVSSRVCFGSRSDCVVCFITTRKILNFVSVWSILVG